MLVREYSLAMEGPLGPMELRGTERGVTAVRFVDVPSGSRESLPAVLLRCREELRGYFEGRRRHFTVPLVMRSTDFQQAVWDALLDVPFGNTISYGALAGAVDAPLAARAVGNAVRDNPFAIIVPCHRVLPAGGALGKYASGPERKAWLLRHEGVTIGAASHS